MLTTLLKHYDMQTWSWTWISEKLVELQSSIILLIVIHHDTTPFSSSYFPLPYLNMKHKKITQTKDFRELDENSQEKPIMFGNFPNFPMDLSFSLLCWIELIIK